MDARKLEELAAQEIERRRTSYPPMRGEAPKGNGGKYTLDDQVQQYTDPGAKYRAAGKFYPGDIFLWALLAFWGWILLMALGINPFMFEVPSP
jgi:hypothetical protein